MTGAIPIDFLSPRDELERRVAAARALSVHQRLMAAVDTLAAVEAISLASECRKAQLQWQRQFDEQCRRGMEEFIAEHVQS